MKRRLTLDTRIIKNLIKLGEDRIENITSNHYGETRRAYRAEIARIKRSTAPLEAALVKRRKRAS